MRAARRGPISGWYLKLLRHDFRARFNVASSANPEYWEVFHEVTEKFTSLTALRVRTEFLVLCWSFEAHGT